MWSEWTLLVTSFERYPQKHYLWWITSVHKIVPKLNIFQKTGVPGTLHNRGKHLMKNIRKLSPRMCTTHWTYFTRYEYEELCKIVGNKYVMKGIRQLSPRKCTTHWTYFRKRGVHNVSITPNLLTSFPQPNHTLCPKTQFLMNKDVMYNTLIFQKIGVWKSLQGDRNKYFMKDIWKLSPLHQASLLTKMWCRTNWTYFRR
jgi:hypothetical protein